MPRGERTKSRPSPRRPPRWHSTLEDALRRGEDVLTLGDEEDHLYEYKVVKLRRVRPERPPEGCLSGLLCGWNGGGHRTRRKERWPEQEEEEEEAEEEEEEEGEEEEEEVVGHGRVCRCDCHRPPPRPLRPTPPVLGRRPEAVTLSNLSDTIDTMLRPVDTFCDNRLRGHDSQAWQARAPD